MDILKRKKKQRDKKEYEIGYSERESKREDLKEVTTREKEERKTYRWEGRRR